MRHRCQGRLPEAEVVRNVNREEMGRLGLTAAEVDDIVAFLLTLTDGYRPERPALPAVAAPRSSETRKQ